MFQDPCGAGGAGFCNNKKKREEEKEDKQAGLLQNLWTFAYKSAVFVHNRFPNSRTIWRTPLEACFEPKINNNYPFGAREYVKDQSSNMLTCQIFGRWLWVVFLGWRIRTICLIFCCKFCGSWFKTNFDNVVLSNKETGGLRLNQVLLKLGKVPVEVIFKEQDNMIDKTPQLSNLELAINLKHVKSSELWGWCVFG